MLTYIVCVVHACGTRITKLQYVFNYGMYKQVLNRILIVMTLKSIATHFSSHILFCLLQNSTAGRRRLQAGINYLVTITALDSPNEEAAATAALTAIGLSVLSTIKANFPGTNFIGGSILLPKEGTKSSCYQS